MTTKKKKKTNETNGDSCVSVDPQQKKQTDGRLNEDNELRSFDSSITKKKKRQARKQEPEKGKERKGV